MLNRRRRKLFNAAVLLTPLLLCPILVFAEATPPATTQPTTQPTLTARPSQPRWINGSGPSRVSFAQTVIIPIPEGLGMGGYIVGAASESGFISMDHTVFFGVEIYSVSGEASSLTENDLAPAAISQLHARWGDLVAADAPIEIQHDSKYALELHYSMHLCHGVLPLVDRYAKVGKNLMRVTVIPMPETTTAEQFAAMSAAAEQTTTKLISSATPYTEQTKQEQPKQRPQPSAIGLPHAAATPTKPAIGAAAPGVMVLKPTKETPEDKVNHRAELALAQAQKLQTDGKDGDAYERFKFVAKEYAQTPSAEAANQAIATYEADEKFMAKYNGKAPTSQPTALAKPKLPADSTSKAKQLLSMAENYAAAGQSDLAMKKYQAVIDQFPNTSEAATARQKLDALKN